MADRIRPTRATGDRGRGTIVIGAGRLTDPPGPFPETPPPRSPSVLGSQQLGNRAGQREITVNPAEGVVPVDFGGPFPVGGHVIFARRVGGVAWVEYSLGEGPIPSDGIVGINWNGLTAAEVHAQVELHYGIPGDTTSTLISQIEPTYTRPDGIASVACRFDRPDDVSFSPWSFQVKKKKGLKLYDVTLGTNPDAASKNPALQVWRMLTDTVFSIGKSSTELLLSTFQFVQAQCDIFVDAPIVNSIKAWETSIRFDTQDTLENHIQILLDHCFGHLLWDGGKYGVWLDAAQAVALDESSNPILFRDNDSDPLNGVYDANTSAEITYQTKARSQKPTVVIVEGTDSSKDFLNSTAQYPASVPGTTPWIEKRVRRSGLLTTESMLRHAKQLYLTEQLDKDILVPTWESGKKVLPGDRIRLNSRNLLGAAEVNPNIGAVAGQEDVLVDDLTLDPNLGVVLRCSLYRESVYAIPALGSATPAAPTNLQLIEVRDIGPVGSVTWALKLTWTPQNIPYYRGTKVEHRINGGAYVQDGEFVENVFRLPNPTLGAVYDFNLYTYLLNGTSSAAATISITVSLGTVPEVVQEKINLVGYYYGYGPVWNQRGKPVTPIVAALAAGSVPNGNYLAAYSEVDDTGESPMSDSVPVTCGGGFNKISVSGMTSVQGNLRFFKVYITGPGGTVLYVQSSTQSSVEVFNAVPAQGAAYVQPPLTDVRVDHYDVLDNYGSPANPPLVLTIPGSSPPHVSKPFNLRGLMHGSGGNGVISVIIQVVLVGGARSVGKAVSGTGLSVPVGETPATSLKGVVADTPNVIVTDDGTNYRIAVTENILTWPPAPAPWEIPFGAPNFKGGV